MKNRVQILAAALIAFSAYAESNGIPQPAKGFSTKDTTMFITADLKGKGGAEVQLVDANTKRLDGITNFDGNKLTAGRNLVLDGVRVRYEDTELTVGAAKWNKAMHAAVLNSELVVSQGEELFILPLTDIYNGGTGTNNGDDFRDLAHLPILKSNLEFKISLRFASGATVPANATSALFRLEFRATEVFAK